MTLADPRVPPSLQHLFPEGSDFVGIYEKTVNEIVAEARQDLNLPFDELYHRQKKVI